MKAAQTLKSGPWKLIRRFWDWPCAMIWIFVLVEAMTCTAFFSNTSAMPAGTAVRSMNPRGSEETNLGMSSITCLTISEPLSFPLLELPMLQPLCMLPQLPPMPVQATSV
eukprot:CAMPEP_0197693358 /NCGR_PEP_ID=MMETSP1338-20131121/112402_1 /TAXON_ID=43686 ORGANISM="Pelagodinium beii, Strain RCC1491" /NCGR_SAMPLE_ID=MMETSP1338 /ASSEMBLY_ACC=CAM_ASM_000754 /LENGTH=109 /DNA_ID=CAMNT_0043276093 /DNA_START=25 /DNA_END=351 /DNA_ORIENTATION=-